MNRQTKLIHPLHWLLFCLALLLAACGNQHADQVVNNDAEVAVRFALPGDQTSGNSRAIVQPSTSEITAVRLTISGEGMADIVDNFSYTTGQVVTRTFLISSGPNRRFSVDGFNTSGSLIFHGEQTLDLTAGQQVALNLDAREALAPTVESHAPSSGETSVAVSDFIGIAVSEALDESTLTTSNITVTSGSSVNVTGTITFNSSTLEITYTPSGDLSGGTTYTVSLSNGVKDLAGNGMTPYSFSFTTAETINIQSVSAGDGFSVVLKNDGSLWTWGNNSNNQLAQGDTIDRNIPEQVGTATDWTAVSTGSLHALALKQNGTLWAWGNNTLGQLGDGTNTERSSPTQIGTDTNWQTVAAGGLHTLAIKTDGSLWAWGNNTNGETGVSPFVAASSNLPARIGLDTNWSKIARGSSHNLAVKTTGTLWAWGANDSGQLGNGTTTPQYSPIQIGTDTDWSQVSAGSGISFAVKMDGTLWAWGSGISGNAGANPSTVPAQVGTAADWVNVQTALMSGGNTFATKQDGSLWAWGTNRYGQTGQGNNQLQEVTKQTGTTTNWHAVSGGLKHTIAMSTDGTVYTWGSRTKGALGDNQWAYTPTPTQIGSATNWSDVDVGANHALATTTTNELWAWGENANGQLGDSTDVNRQTPTRIGALSNWTYVSAGGFESTGFSLAQNTSLELYAWGDNTYGQLAQGDNTDRSSPTKVGVEIDWDLNKGEAGGSGHAVVPNNFGVVRTWGNNTFGQLGDGSTNHSTTPIEWAGDAFSIPYAAAGEGWWNAHSLFLLEESTASPSLWSAGRNTAGQLGNGTTTDNTFGFSRIGTDTDWAKLSAGEQFSMAIKNNGTLWAWGDNGNAQFGDGTFTSSTTPKRVGALTIWKTVDTGWRHTVALRTDNTLWAWGSNTAGQLGSGNTISVSSPQQVGSNTWQTISTSGDGTTLAIRSDGTLWGWGNNADGQLGTGNAWQTTPAAVTFP